MRSILFVISLSFFTTCTEKKEPTKASDIDTTSVFGARANPWVQNILNSICPLDTNQIIGPNNYLFCQSNRWDTSFTLILKREPSKVVGVYYEILPSGNLSVAYGKTLLFTEGFSFEADTAVWKLIIDASEFLINSPYKEFGCCDCPSFTIAHNHHTNFSDARSLDDFKRFGTFLKKALVGPIRRQKEMFE